MKILPIISLIILLSSACGSKPKVVQASTKVSSAATSSGIFSETTPHEHTPATPTNSSPFEEELHKVVVNEILPASRYLYLKVNEDGKEFWIATRKQEVEQGATYYYVGGLLKTEFESKEYNRVFDRIYLVSKLVSHLHGQAGVKTPKINSQSWTEDVKPKVNIPAVKSNSEGFITIAELVKSPQKYEGQTIRLQGTCIKVNPSIMNRNWIHLQDGTADHFDLVITSSTFISEGTMVQMKGTVVLNKDFGAGYAYDLIIENGQVEYQSE